MVGSAYAANARKPFLAVAGVPVITIGKAAFGPNPTYAAIGLRCVACKAHADRARAGALSCPPSIARGTLPGRIAGVGVSSQPGLLAAIGGAIAGAAFVLLGGRR